MQKLNDQHYINLVIGGDVHAFAVLVDRYKNLVFTLSLKMLQSREEAEEVAQDVFIKVYKSLEKFKTESKFSTWLYRITYNSCIDTLRSKKRNASLFSLNDFEEDEVVSLINVLDTIEERERKQMIQKCLSLLPPEESFLLNLYYFQGNSLKEISKIMSINENNLKIKLFRSRRRLAGILKTQLEPEIINQYENEGR
ncbi:MAG TPA: sigma-70 family RNA polymerase sigma factor [Hanamia sp.]|nr:sigma-70 family RNA polymerase sigma factor [Hanamia sp.]